MKKVFIHIGNFKTGSTSLQNFIYLNRNLLKKCNIEVLLEKINKVTTNNISLFRYINNRNSAKIIKYFSKVKKNKNLLITSEYFSSLSYDLNKLIFLKKTMKKLGFNPLIIFYYRDDSYYLYSFYSELLKHRKLFKVDNVFKFIKKIRDNGYYFIDTKKDSLSHKYYFDNIKIKRNWKKIFGKNFYIVKFSKNKKEKIFKDFLKFLNLKNEINFKIPIEFNKTRKLKFWNLKRLFYLIYLKLEQKKLFNTGKTFFLYTSIITDLLIFS